MYSIFLVEDEVLFRRTLKKVIAWEDYGFDFVGEAEDGEVAWPMIRKLKPDIVITDIKMPFMDGIELSKLIKKELPNTTTIVLSGYDDADYERDAINSGASQYLQKPISKDQLIDIMVAVKKKRDKAAEREQYGERFALEAQTWLSSPRRTFFDTLVSGSVPVSELHERAAKLKLDLAAEQYNIVLFLIEEDFLQEHYSSALASVQSRIDGAFLDNDNFIMFSIGLELIAILVKADETTMPHETTHAVDVLQDICKMTKENIRWTIVTGQPTSRLSAIPQCYRAVRKLLFLHGGAADNIISAEAAAADTGASASAEESEKNQSYDLSNIDLSKVGVRLVEKFLVSGMSEEIGSFIDDYCASFGANALSSEMLRHYILLKIQIAVMALLGKYGYTKEEIAAATKVEQLFEEAHLDGEGSKEYLKALLKEAVFLRDKAASGRYREMMEDVEAFLSEHYSDPALSLNDVAKVANVSATHFSKLFSRETGKTFVEHLTELRMEKACELLRCTGLRSNEIAAKVGYNDPHYFSFLFKKVNKCTPRDYRDATRERNQK